MPVVRKLSPEEVRVIENKGKGQRKLVEEEYDSFLAGYEVGDYGEADLGENENRLTIRNRFKAAATRRGFSLEFKRSTGNTLRFRIVSADSATNGDTQRQEDTALDETLTQPAPEESVTATGAVGKGRRRKTQAA